MLGVLPGIVGSFQANEALKLLLGIGETLAGPAAPARCARHDPRRGRREARSVLPGLRRAPDNHRVRGLRRVLRRGARVTKVRIPPTLRAEVGGEREVIGVGETCARSWRTSPGATPALEGQLFESGAIAPFVNVYLGGEDVRTLEGLETRVNGSSLILLPAMAGGR